MSEVTGEPIHAEVDSSDASGGVAFTIYPMGSTTARALGTGEHLNITDFLIGTAAGGLIKIVTDADAAGKIVFKGTVAVTNAITHHFQTPFACPRGVVPKLIAPSGAVSCVICGTITKA